jgi:hypothetical protein
MKDRLLNLWVNVVGLVICPLAMAMIVFQWPPTMRVPLTVLASVAIVGTSIATSGWIGRARRRLRG